MPRNAVNVPPHWVDADAVTTPWAGSVDDMNADNDDDAAAAADDSDDGDDDNNNIFSARPAATRAKT